MSNDRYRYVFVDQNLLSHYKRNNACDCVRKIKTTFKKDTVATDLKKYDLYTYRSHYTFSGKAMEWIAGIEPRLSSRANLRFPQNW